MNHVWRGGNSAFRYSDKGAENNQFSVSEKIISFFDLNKNINVANKKEVFKNILKIRSKQEDKTKSILMH